MTESKEHKEHIKPQIDQIVSNIINKDISEEMKSSYIDYSMSVIVGRALPDVRDGLKPVHRRILYTMDEMGLKHNKPYKKSARVVGDVLGKYHPHGDMAVYDSLVRMVQPFSLRCPLIDGQGNFGCFTKDTKVKLTDGRDIAFEDLIREYKKGKKNYTYTVNTDNNIEIAEIKNPRMTQKQAQIMKVVLDNETEIKCTLNHKFMLMDGSYKEAKFLKPGDSLMPVYLRLSNEKDGFKPELLGYQMIYVPLQNKWGLCHILADEWNLKHEAYTKSAGRIRHHIDFNKLNNNPDNIKRIPWKEHWNLHKEIAALQHQNVDYREKIALGRKKFWSKPEICSYILKKHNKILEILYENTRKEIFKTSFPNWHRGASKYFNNDINMIFYELHRNHKVKKVEITNQREDVYDLTIEDTHNFALSAGIFVHNSVDGDPAAAMRYTEVRLAQIADELLSDIEKETVKFGPNYDGSLQEPLVLPSKLPNLLVNGSSGIAVGMATNIPTHNLSEVCDASITVINNPEIGAKELMKTVKGPDFPTGSSIRGRQGIKDYFETGRGSIKIQARAEIEDIKGGRQAVIVNEIPYQVNKSILIESIADLVRNKKINDISDIRDESDRRGMRIVIEIKRDGNAQVVLNQLYKHTQMETSFGVIMLAIVDGKPRVLPLKEVIVQHIKHRKSVITDRTKYDLNKALQRAHILEGFLIAIKNLDAVIAIIKKSKDAQEAKQKLMSQFALTEIQTQAILDMRLHQLTRLEVGQIEEEHKGLLKLVEELRGILSDPKKVLKIIIKEFEELKAKYGEERKTQIMSEATELSIEDLIPEEKVVITMSHSGYIKRIPADTYKVQGRGGKGVIGSDVREEDFIEHLFVTSSHATILLFTSRGKVYPIKGYEIPEGNRMSRGKAIINLLAIKDEKITSVIAIESFEEAKGKETYLVMCTRKGKIKKTLIKNFANIRKNGITAINLEDGDVLTSVGHTNGKYEIMIGTKDGMSIRFPESNIRGMGRVAKGVKGIKLGKNDLVVGMEVIESETEKTLLTVCENGYGKRTDLEEYRNQSRAGRGVITIKATERNGSVVGIKLVSNEDHLMVMTEKGQIIRIFCKDIRTISRNTQGVRLVKLEEGDKIAGIEPIVEESVQAEGIS